MNNQPPKKAVSRSAARKAAQKRRQVRIRRFIGGAFFFIMFYLIFCVIYMAFIALSISLRRTDPQPHLAEITLMNYKTDDNGKIKSVEEKVDFSAVKKTSVKQRASYMPVSCFEFLGADITPAGDAFNTVTVILNDAGEWASFTVDTPKANINGMGITMEAVSVMKNGELYIPFEFFRDHVTGIVVEQEKNSYTVKPKDGETIAFTNKPAQETPSITETDHFDDMPIEFKADLEKYEQYMNPKNRDDFLYVVNVNNLLSEDFEPEDLRKVEYTKPDREKQKMCLNAQMAADAMMIEARANGYRDIWVTSAYRSYTTQSWLYQNEVESLRDEYGEMAEEKAKESVNPPGASEHQTGLTADIHNLSTASMKFAGTPQAKWLEENCQYFGFILRYPEDKTEITGIMYEPWHFRYVGRFHAMRMYELDMCLEEYVEYLKK